MRRTEFHAEVAKTWKRSLQQVLGPVPPATATWHRIEDISGVLAPFMGSNVNHAHLPSGGGFDFAAVRPAAEHGCLDFEVEERMAEIVKPTSLTLEYLPDAPVESFLFLELADLQPTKIGDARNAVQEELVELKGRYIRRDVWDEGRLGHDERGHEIPLPAEARLVTRWLNGKIMIVAKGSIWNGIPGTYDGRHNRATSPQVRRKIERLIAAS